MSLASIYHNKALDDALALADKDANVMHVWVHVWMVECTNNGQPQPLLFNPIFLAEPGVHCNARHWPAMENIAHCNRVYSVRTKLCEHPCDLMNYTISPKWSRVVDDSVAHLKLCEACAHSIEHDRESKAREGQFIHQTIIIENIKL